MSELIKKVKAGVKVRFIYDWVGCANRFPKKYIKELKEAGVCIAKFNPHGLNIFKGATNFRSHRKGIIIDNKIALYGGSNIGDEYLSIDKKTNYFKDLNYIVEGEVVNSLNLLFCQDFCFMTDIKRDSKQFNDVYKKLNKILVPKKVSNVTHAQVVESSPDYEGKTIKNQILNLILKAKRSINIISPYFFPTDDIVDCLIIASQSGIKVRLVCPGQNDDKTFVTLLNRNNYKKMIDAKIKVYEFNGFIHSKLMIIDNKYVFTGSNNLDYRSL
ncbi:MAG: phosphatidylserine/phosphatidylglycerophosphate/cardiolipin synthase family protein [Mycoplasmoidaceae bacterium]|nr:phosphatidylserine/phosphatidylglycerophosphate/cardiolipin synthase family protein [Mycoplasmoidaceae bacterium]